ncbi:PKD domain-containing protein [Anaeromyxobacter paludicola]|uniref:PKD domain-containing protein n=1 Tax=Anaeromyxobacter paludicola TaxID=2918171 RepID=UPI0020C1686E|nr:hypothetical protein [Anaeromyxobacter paludicola]
MPRASASLLLLAVLTAAPSVARAAASPVVDAVTVDVDPVPSNAPARVTCAAHDPAGGILAFAIRVSAGTLAGGVPQPDGSSLATVPISPATPASQSLTWLTPDLGTAVTVTCTVTGTGTRWDGKTHLTAARSIVVTTTSAQPPVIDGLIAPTGDVVSGAQATFRIAAHDPLGGTLTYDWSASGGTIAASGDTAMWTAPQQTGSYTVAVTATSSSGTARASATVNVATAAFQGSFSAGIGAPQRVAVGSDGRTWVVDAQTGDVVCFTPRGELMGRFTPPDRALAVAATAAGIAVSTGQGNIHYLDPASGRVLRTISPGPVAYGLAYDRTRNLLWAAERDMSRVRAFLPDGSSPVVLTQAGDATAGFTPLVGVTAVAVDSVSGTIWAVLFSNETGLLAHAFRYDGAWLRSAIGFGGGAGQVTRAGGAAVDASGSLYVTDMFQGHVAVVTSGGSPLGALGSFGSGPGQLNLPTDVAIAPTGDILVASQGVGRLERFGRGTPLPTCPNDADCDGMPDDWELKYGFDPHFAGDALLDADGDGLTNLEEYLRGTNPRNRDTDGDGVSDGDEIAMGTNPLDSRDQKPSLVPPSPRTSDPGLVRFSVTLKSRSSCTVSWRQRLGPTVTLRDATTFTPSFVGRTAARYQFVGSARCGSVVTPDAVLEATIRNVAPRPDAGRLAVVRPGAPVALDGRLTADANADTVSYAWDQTSGAALIGPSAGAMLNLRARQPGLSTFRLTARDGGGLNASAEVPVLVVSAPGEAPAARVTSPSAGQVGVSVQLDASASYDPTGGSATYAWQQVGGPAVTLAGAATATPSFTPAAPGRYAFEVSLATSRSRSPAARAEVLVGAGPALPTAAVAQPVLSGAAGEPVELDGSPSVAAAGGALEYAWRQVSGPAAGLTDATRAVATVVPFYPGVHIFELLVTENGSPGVPVRVEVDASAPGRGIPQAAVAAPGPATVDQAVTLDGTASRDPDGHALRFRWTQTGGPWVPLDDAASQAPTFRPHQPGTYVFELEVDDYKIRSAPVTATVTVSPVQGGNP